jgi:crotonobetainyl-CoA:carnitine CoA-transferase CaiB-like acyl-CoA transferase
MAGPLSGIRVVELGQVIGGPFGGQLLGDFGAEVVKIEPPGTGDVLRQWGKTDGGGGDSLWWSVAARNKRSVTIDLRTSEGQQLVRDLVMHADILVENFRPGTLERGSIATVHDERRGELRMQDIAPKFSATPCEIRWTDRPLGADTDAVLTELLGLASEQLKKKLHAQGVIGGSPGAAKEGSR